MRFWAAWVFVGCIVLGACDGAVAETDSGPPSETDAGPPSETDAGLPAQSTEAVIPAVTGTCPDMSATGVVTFAPAGIGPRQVQIYVSDAAAGADGPLVFYWHGAGSQPAEAVYGMGAVMDTVLAAGGMVAAPIHDPAAGDFPWYLTVGSGTNDLVLADEILACAAAGPGVDTTRIHAMGMSAGGLHTSQMAFRRSSYLASVVIYSGGLFVRRTPPIDEPANRLPVLMFHGGTTDQVVIQFDDASRNLWDVLDGRGQLAIICDHGRGHMIPTDAQPDVQAFFEAHPFGTVPSPWQAALPSDFYEVCALAP